MRTTEPSSPITRCPRCDVVGLLHPHSSSDGHYACIRCKGEFLCRDHVQTVIIDQYGIDARMLEELKAFKGGKRLACPQCDTQSSPFVLRGYPLELCGKCGGLWVDHGVLMDLATLVSSQPAEANESENPAPTVVNSTSNGKSEKPNSLLKRKDPKARSNLSLSHAVLLVLVAAELLFVLSLWSQGAAILNGALALTAVAAILGIISVIRFFRRKTKRSSE